MRVRESQIEPAGAGVGVRESHREPKRESHRESQLEPVGTRLRVVYHPLLLLLLS